jgi:hypoxanthine phosphoribosyltransferase
MKSILVKDIKTVFFSEEDINKKVIELADKISEDYVDKRPVLIGILKGSYVFLSDLSRKMAVDHTVEFMSVSSYGNGTVSSGKLKIELDMRESIENKDVIIVEDILDSGRTLKGLMELLSERKPKSIEIVVLLRKPENMKVAVEAKYLGWDIADHFVVGYGLDYAERYRQLPFIGILKKHVYKN